MQSFEFCPAPTPQRGESLRIFALSDVPGCEETTATFDAPVLALHLGTPARVYQRRASKRFDATFHEGQLSLIPARCDSSCSTKDHFSFVHLQWGAQFLAELSERELPSVHRFEDATCQTLLASMLQRARTQGRASRLYLESAAIVLAERLLELHASRPPTVSAGLAPALVARAEEYFRARMSENPGMAEVAASVGLSVRHFTRLFKQSTGVSPHRYFDAVRIEHARALLTRAAPRVLEVAFEVGFANPSHFAAFFQRATGYSPQEFRRRNAPSATRRGRAR